MVASVSTHQMALLKRNFKISEKSKQSILLKMNQKIADAADTNLPKRAAKICSQVRGFTAIEISQTPP